MSVHHTAKKNKYVLNAPPFNLAVSACTAQPTTMTTSAKSDRRPAHGLDELVHQRFVSEDVRGGCRGIVVDNEGIEDKDLTKCVAVRPRAVRRCRPVWPADVETSDHPWEDHIRSSSRAPLEPRAQSPHVTVTRASPAALVQLKLTRGATPYDTACPSSTLTAYILPREGSLSAAPLPPVRASSLRHHRRWQN